ncbi:MAG: hypothetical protein ACTSUJ_05040 [Candidatus Njordarchaeales archaeon]
MSIWDIIMSDKTRAIGEVAGIEGGKIEIFVYPEYFSRVRIGSILIINSEQYKPMGLVLKLAHSSRYGTFTPMKMTRSEITSTYPDLERYHLFVSTIAYTSHLDERKNVKHARAGPPKLHDLVFLVNNDQHKALSSFFKPNNSWNFDFLRYFFAEGASRLEFRDFLIFYRDFFEKMRNEKENILQALIKSIIRAGVEHIGEWLEEISDVLNW